MKYSRLSGRSRKRSVRPEFDGFAKQVWSLSADRLDEHQLTAYRHHYSYLNPKRLEVFNDSTKVSKLVTIVKQHNGKTVEEVLEAIKQHALRLSSKSLTDRGACAALAFVLKLWLFAWIPLQQTAGRKETLETLCRSFFAQDACALATMTSTSIERIPDDFCAKKLKRAGGFYIHFTSDLSKHLTFLAGKKNRLWVFNHVQALEQYQDGPEKEFFPTDFLEETRTTINLMYPIDDIKEARYVKKIARRNQVDIEAVGSPEPHSLLQNYPHYHARLSEILRRYDAAQSFRWQQIWYDRRKRPQWIALMVAVGALIAGVLLGIGQLVVGIVQTVRQ